MFRKKLVSFSFFFVFALLFMIPFFHTDSKAYAAERTYPKGGATDTLTFSSSTYWYAGSNVDWIIISPKTNGQGGTDEQIITYIIKPNTTNQNRTGYFLINRKKEGVLKCNITQFGKQSDSIKLITYPSGMSSCEKSTLNLTFTAVEDWYIDQASSYLSFSQTSGHASTEKQTVSVNLSRNADYSERFISFTIHNADKTCSHVISWRQNGIPAIQDAHVSSYLIARGGSTQITFTAKTDWEIFYLPSFVTSVTEYYGSAGTYTIKITVSPDARDIRDEVVIYCGCQKHSYDIYVSAY